MGDKPFSNNPIGQFADDVVHEVKGVASDTAKQVAAEPMKILEQILGGKPPSGDKGIEDVAATSGTGGNDPQQRRLLMMKQMEDRKKSQALLNLHRQNMRDAEEYFQISKQKEQAKLQEEQMNASEEHEKKVLQLQRDNAKSAQLSGQTHGRLGSHEQGDKHKG